MRAVVCGGRLGATKKELELARKLGQELALAGFETVSGATIGLTFEVIRGAKEAGGKTFGVSPAKSKKEHVQKYRYPLQHFDRIEFTGAGIPGRNILLVDKSSLTFFVGGSIGTLHEFTVALRRENFIGALSGIRGVSSHARAILKIVNLNSYPRLASSKNPRVLVKKVSKKIGSMLK
jgi:uncharacterized protein (TIGR00725 family)